MGALACSCHLLLSFFQVEVENFVLRVAAEFSSRKEQLVFLINNYDMMLGVLMVPEALSPCLPPWRIWVPPTAPLPPRGQRSFWLCLVFYSCRLAQRLAMYSKCGEKGIF